MRTGVIVLLIFLILLLLLGPSVRDAVWTPSDPVEGAPPPEPAVEMPPPLAEPAPPAGGPVTPGPVIGAAPPAAPEPVVREADIGFLLEPEDLVVAPGLAGAAMRLSFRPERGGGSTLTFAHGNSIGFWQHLDGPAEVEISAVKDGVLVRARRRVVLGAEPVRFDPPLHLQPGAGVRARVVDSAGERVPHVRILVARPEEEPGPGFDFAPGPEGWITYADLEPGVDHRVVVYGLPDPMERTVRVPYEPRGMAVEEIRLSERLVSVELTFTHGGEPLDLTSDDEEAEEGEVDEVFLRCAFSGRSIPLPDRMIPGRYELRVRDLHAFLEVVAIDRLAVTVEFERRE